MIDKILKKTNNFYNGATIFDRILGIIIIFSIILFAYVFFRKSASVVVTLKVGQSDVSYSIYAPASNINPSGVSAWFKNSFHTGMMEKDGFGSVQAEVLDVNSYYTGLQRLSLYLKTRLRATYNRSTNQFTYKGTPVVIGSRIKLYMDNVLVDGLITEVDNIPDTREKKTIIADAQLINHNGTFLETSGVDDFYASAINVGDEAKDTQGNIIIKIIDKKVEPAKKTVTTANGGILIQRDPLRKDIYLKLEMHATKTQDRYFIMDDVVILTGQEIPVNLSTTSIFPTITKIDEIK